MVDELDTRSEREQRRAALERQRRVAELREQYGFTSAPPPGGAIPPPGGATPPPGGATPPPGGATPPPGGATPRPGGATPAPGGPAVPYGRPIRRFHWRHLVAAGVLLLVGAWLAFHQSPVYFHVTSASMEPTLHVGSRVPAVSETTVKVGDVVVFHPPQAAVLANPVCGASAEGAGYSAACGVSDQTESSTVFIKRIVAGPGDTVAIQNGLVVRNGTVERRPVSCDDATRCSFPTPVRVPSGEYYMLGDNRGVSDDSRFWGPVPQSWIVGIVVSCSLLRVSCHPIR
jgi:signal peptidase I